MKGKQRQNKDEERRQSDAVSCSKDLSCWCAMADICPVVCHGRHLYCGVLWPSSVLLVSHGRHLSRGVPWPSSVLWCAMAVICPAAGP